MRRPRRELSENRLLLHICCGPDATVPWPELTREGFDTAGYFYGGNIHPREEYERRLEAARAAAAAAGGRLFTPVYETGGWFGAVRGLEHEPERGARCAVCFRLQLEAAAVCARKKGFSHLCTTLTISPHKDAALINEIGADVASENGLLWEKRVWRKGDGFRRSVAESRRLGLYRQNYCGCLFSMREPAVTEVK